MATYTGNSGVVMAGTNAVGEVVRFTVNQQANRIDDTVLGDANRTYKSGVAEVTGTVECYYDAADTGQSALTIGADVNLDLRPRGTGSGLPTLSVAATITGVDGPSVGYDEIITRTFTWAATGTLTSGTQT